MKNNRKHLRFICAKPQKVTNENKVPAKIVWRILGQIKDTTNRAQIGKCKSWKIDNAHNYRQCNGQMDRANKYWKYL